MRSRKTLPVIADLCLYGNSQTGAGFLLAYADGSPMYGTGEPRADYSFTACVWDVLREAFATKGRGIVRVFEPGGLRMAQVIAGTLPPTFGMMAWEPAPVYTFSVEELLKHAE